MRPVGATSVGEPEGAPPERPRRRRRAVLIVAVVLAVALAAGLWWVSSGAPAPVTTADVDQAVQRGIEQAQEAERNVPPEATTAYRMITPSLVTVTTQRTGGATTETGLGSGVVVNAGGAVLTALHVVDGATQIQVDFADGTRAAAQVTASRPEHDVAVLAVDRLPEVVVPAVLAGPPPVGGTVFAVGNPLGLQRSLTAGVVSANDRTITPPRGPALQGLIQFDAAVNPGNSGGPLLNGAGQVVGIVTALANPANQDFFVGVGFAVPITTAGGAAGGPQQ
ncbi:S1C family serine protease [Pseudonocardia charpentierae]|uniref:Trypsin-like peptidase domain-containing protein n=1 Tax=Pseudonocardia charpentierae TaxID=3075545 RepID=A0ABU2N8N9_9PSEU|nr:trypsin-like peptidase domain-containing protein [Pseudonocardia sp. DSM 45834]MDT0350298.1 trypsin-like peptidase domain-containing protein [Pseudonocardia sp. DSM 45834]